MSRLLLALPLLLPSLGYAQDSPEKLLPASAQLYFRWDGVQAHKDLYAKTALGKMLAGDTGKFLKSIYKELQEGLGSLLTVQGLLEGQPPEKVQKLQDDVTRATRVIELFADRGFLLSAEVRSVNPPAGQVTLIIPDADKDAEKLFGTIRLLATLASADIKQTKADGKIYQHLEIEPINVGWWLEGKHAVVIVSTEKIEAAAKKMRAGNHARLDSAPLYKRLKAFKDFPPEERAALERLAGWNRH